MRICRNQEQLEKLKKCILDEINREDECSQAAEHTVNVIESIKTTLLDLILKLQEVDETIDPQNLKSNKDDIFELADILSGNVSNELLLEVHKHFSCSYMISSFYKLNLFRF